MINLIHAFRYVHEEIVHDCTISVAAAILLQRLGEMRLHVLNRRFLLRHGGKESLPMLMHTWLWLDLGFIVTACGDCICAGFSWCLASAGASL